MIDHYYDKPAKKFLLQLTCLIITSDVSFSKRETWNNGNNNNNYNNNCMGIIADNRNIQ